MHASCKAFNVFPPDNVTFSFRSGSGSFLDVNYALESQLNSSNETYDVTAKLIIMANRSYIAERLVCEVDYLGEEESLEEPKQDALSIIVNCKCHLQQCYIDRQV